MFSSISNKDDIIDEVKMTYQDGNKDDIKVTFLGKTCKLEDSNLIEIFLIC